MKEGNTLEIDNPGNWPEPFKIERVTEPYIKAIDPHAGGICRPDHGALPRVPLDEPKLVYLSVGRVEVISEMPLGEVLFDFYGKLKTVTRGYGSFDYTTIDYRETDVVKVEILVNSEPVDALAYLVHRDKARPGAALLRAACRGDSAAPVQDPDPRLHRRQDHRPLDDRTPIARM